MLDNAEGMLVVPSGSGKGKPVIVDLAKIVKAQSRIVEIATTNQHNAPELMAFFLGCWRDLHDAVTDITEQRSAGEDTLRRAKAEALLGADEKLKLRNSKPSADLREAIVETDDDVIKTRERLLEIEANLSWAKGRTAEFEAAWRSVRTILETLRQPPARLHGDGQAPAAFGADEASIAAAYKKKPEPDAANISDDPLSDLPPGLVGTVRYY